MTLTAGGGHPYTVGTWEAETVHPTRVLIVDEHQAVRQALEARLCQAGGVEVVGCTGCWEEGIHLVDECAPDVILMETKRSDGKGLSALRELGDKYPHIPVLVLTSYPDPQEQREALETGAAGYLLKEIGSDHLVREIHAAVRPPAAI